MSCLSDCELLNFSLASNGSDFISDHKHRTTRIIQGYFIQGMLCHRGQIKTEKETSANLNLLLT